MKPMFHPHSNFKDAKKWVIIAETGDIRPWPWHYDAAHFKLLPDGNVIHNHPEPKSYAEIVRQGEDANNFFEEEEKMGIENKKWREIRIGERKNHGRIGVDPTYFSLRKRKYRRKKYKNSRNRKKDTDRLKKKHREQKIFKKTHGSLIRERNHFKIEKCSCCWATSEERNLFRDPFYYRHCDFCSVMYEKNCDKGMVLCERCAHNICFGFCQDCEKNLGKWSPYWREAVFRYIVDNIS